MLNETTKPLSIVIFGASGDLTQRKLIPALFNLCRKDRLPGNHQIIGMARRSWDNDQFRAVMRDAVDKFADYTFKEEEWVKFASGLVFCPGNFTVPEDYQPLRTLLEKLENGPADRLYYFSTPPEFVADIVKTMSQAKLFVETGGWRRVVVEKPFGTDLASAGKLNQTLHQCLDEKQIFRIDHYLGKETVQNLQVFRFANLLFEAVWSNQFIDHVQITVAENIGLENRAHYYDHTGVLKDMFQNHLMQLLSLIALEPPTSADASSLHEEKMKVLRSVRRMTQEDIRQSVIIGQYAGYKDEPDVDPNSRTETFAAMRLWIDNPRWQGVPFYLRSGKCLAERTSEIIIQFKRPPAVMLPLVSSDQIKPDFIALCIQPDNGIHLQFEAKVPDTFVSLRPVDMEFHYRDSFENIDIPDAYERLLLDAVHGDLSLFIRADETEAAWKLLDPIIAGRNPDPIIYEPGSWGPAEADQLMQKDGREWLKGCEGHHIHTV